MTHVGTKVVWGCPDEIKPIKGISPLVGTIAIQFTNSDVATVKINRGPKLWIEDKGDYWLVGGETNKIKWRRWTYFKLRRTWFWFKITFLRIER